MAAIVIDDREPCRQRLVQHHEMGRGIGVSRRRGSRGTQAATPTATKTPAGRARRSAPMMPAMVNHSRTRPLQKFSLSDAERARRSVEPEVREAEWKQAGCRPRCPTPRSDAASPAAAAAA